MSSSSLTSLAQSRVYAVNNLSTTPITVVPPNPSRSSITFHNPGQVTLAVFPHRAIDPTTGSNYELDATLTTLGGCFVLQFATTLFIGGSSAKMEWHAMSFSGFGNPLTASEE